jgi:uncharacterized protein (TIGR02271 family)
MHKGILFPQDVYVPLNAIAGTSADGIQLNMTKDEVSRQTWDRPPVRTENVDRQTTGTPRESRSDAMGTEHSTPTRNGDVAVPVREEELIAKKQQTDAGSVHIHKDVVEEQQTFNVPVTHEEVTVERVPVQGNAADLGQDAFSERDIDVPVMGEEVTTETRGRVAEELHVHKQAVTEQQQVSGTVRKEHVNLSKEGDVVTRGAGDENLTPHEQMSEEQQPLP